MKLSLSAILARPALLALVIAPALGGCESVSSILGLKRSAPDEFAVVTQAPLVIPPDYKLRPPTPGAARPQQQTPRTEAQRALFEKALGEGRPTTTEQQVLAKAQVDRANPDIKQVVAKETTAVIPKDPGLVDQLMFWNSNKPEPKAEMTIDAGAESRRLTETQLVGAPGNKGKTPGVQDDKPGFFSRMLDWIF